MPPSADVEARRKRKAHTKSRKGCGNCKLRRVKCDETRPRCKQCQKFGVSCNYDGATSGELHHSGEGAFTIEPTVVAPPPAQSPPDRDDFQHMLNFPLPLHDTAEVYRLTAADLDIFRRFRTRTVLSIGTAQTASIYRDAVPGLACAHAYLAHVLFALVLMHDRHLSAEPWKPATVAETFHHYHGTAIFNTMLSRPIAEGEKDAMWAATVLLSAITIASVDAQTADECWPLKPASPSDLDWLRMSDGKKEVWRLADPMREGSIWKQALQMDGSKDLPARVGGREETEALFPCLKHLYAFDSACTGETDPYHSATALVIQLAALECTHSSILHFLRFLTQMAPAYKALLHAKDPKALLLLAWWYASMLDAPTWWLQRRARLECRAICVYLQQRFMQQSEIGALLDYRKWKCGLAVSSRPRKLQERRKDTGSENQAAR